MKKQIVSIVLAALLLAGAASCSNQIPRRNPPRHPFLKVLSSRHSFGWLFLSRVPDNIPSSSQADSSTASGASGQAETNQVVTIHFSRGGNP